MILFTQLTFWSDFSYFMTQIRNNIISVDLISSMPNKLDSAQTEEQHSLLLLHPPGSAACYSCCGTNTPSRKQSRLSAVLPQRLCLRSPRTFQVYHHLHGLSPRTFLSMVMCSEFLNVRQEENPGAIAFFWRMPRRFYSFYQQAGKQAFIERVLRNRLALKS